MAALSIIQMQRDSIQNGWYQSKTRGGDTMAIEVLDEGLENTEVVSGCCIGGASSARS